MTHWRTIILEAPWFQWARWSKLYTIVEEPFSLIRNWQSPIIILETPCTWTIRSTQLSNATAQLLNLTLIHQTPTIILEAPTKPRKIYTRLKNAIKELLNSTLETPWRTITWGLFFKNKIKRQKHKNILDSPTNSKINLDSSFKIKLIKLLKFIINIHDKIENWAMATPSYLHSFFSAESFLLWLPLHHGGKNDSWGSKVLVPSDQLILHLLYISDLALFCCHFSFLGYDPLQKKILRSRYGRCNSLQHLHLLSHESFLPVTSTVLDQQRDKEYRLLLPQRLW